MEIWKHVQMVDFQQYTEKTRPHGLQHNKVPYIDMIALKGFLKKL